MINVFEGAAKCCLALISDQTLYGTVERVMLKEGCRVHEGQNAMSHFDFVLVDLFFTQHGFLPVLKKRSPEIPILFVGWEDYSQNDIAKWHADFHDLILIPRHSDVLAETTISQWLQTPAGRYLFNSREKLSFGSGLWVWIASRMRAQVINPDLLALRGREALGSV